MVELPSGGTESGGQKHVQKRKGNQRYLIIPKSRESWERSLQAVQCED